jgi:hypothetical protein
MTVSDALETFARKFLAGRMRWRAVPRSHAIINFGNIISFCLYREAPFQVELFIVPWQQSSFTVHRHPNVDVIEFGLSGYSSLYVNGKPACSPEAAVAWIHGDMEASLIRIRPEDWHYGAGYTPYAFLSVQEWLQGTPITSVGLDWVGEPSSPEQQRLWTETSPFEARSNG